MRVCVRGGGATNCGCMSGRVCEVTRLRKNVSRFGELKGGNHSDALKCGKGNGNGNGKGKKEGADMGWRVGIGPDRLKQRLGIKLVEFFVKGMW